MVDTASSSHYLFTMGRSLFPTLRISSARLLLVVGSLFCLRAMDANAEFRYIDSSGNIHFVDRPEQVPEKYRDQIYKPTPVVTYPHGHRPPPPTRTPRPTPTKKPKIPPKPDPKALKKRIPPPPSRANRGNMVMEAPPPQPPVDGAGQPLVVPPVQPPQ